MYTGKTRSDHRLKDAHECWTTELGQGLQAGAGTEEGQGDGFLLWAASTGKDAALQVRSVRICIPEGNLLGFYYPTQKCQMLD